MKKWFIVIGVAIAAVIAVVGVVFLGGLRTSAEEKYYIPPIREGKYYMDGDVESGVYLNLEDGKISLKGDRDTLFSLMAEYQQQQWNEEESGTPWALNDTMVSSINDYLDVLCEENVYHSTPSFGELLGLDEKKYMVMYSFTEPDENGFCGGAGYDYDGDDTLTGFREFIYVENV